MSLQETGAVKSWNDPGLCTACRACELICSLHQTGRCDPAAASIRVALDRSDGSVRISLFGSCDLCDGEADGPLCVHFCTAGALTTGHISNVSLSGKGRTGME